jgi:nitrite reductase (NADH) small subunit
MSLELVRTQEQWQAICTLDDLIPDSGICTLVGNQQVAIFYLPSETPVIYAVSNWDPIGEANVMSRGIVGSIGDELVVASPLYKQHFNLATGQCLEQPEHSLLSYPARLENGAVEVKI